jgi:hypothetical protein
MRLPLNAAYDSCIQTVQLQCENNKYPTVEALKKLVLTSNESFTASGKSLELLELYLAAQDPIAKYKATMYNKRKEWNTTPKSSSSMPFRQSCIPRFYSCSNCMSWIQPTMMKRRMPVAARSNARRGREAMPFVRNGSRLLKNKSTRAMESDVPIRKRRKTTLLHRHWTIKTRRRKKNERTKKKKKKTNERKKYRRTRLLLHLHDASFKQ